MRTATVPCLGPATRIRGEDEEHGTDGIRIVDVGGTGPDGFLIGENVARDGAQSDGLVGFRFGLGLGRVG